MTPAQLIHLMASISHLPAVYLAHGGGPLPVLGDPSHASLTNALKSIPKQLNITKPEAIVVVSAHWEEHVPTVLTNPHPALLFDYYGFPPESYKLKYPAPGNPRLAKKILSLLRNHGFPNSKEDDQRGLDHGAFIPLMLTHPSSDIPVIQLSLCSSLDPETHIKIGEALAELRQQEGNVLIYTSGMSFHNMQVFMQSMGGGGSTLLKSKPDIKSIEFNKYLVTALTDPSLTYEQRRDLLKDWKRAPHARYAHPREEHLIPLLVAFGAAKYDYSALVVQSGPLLGAQVSSFAFGAGVGTAHQQFSQDHADL